MALCLFGGYSTLDAAPVFAQPKPPAKGPKTLADSLTGDAKEDYNSGKVLYGDGDFASAAIKFRNAFDKSGDARLLWNLAACEKNLRHYAKTVSLIKQYLALGKDLLTADDRADATQLLSAIEGFTVDLTINVSEAGAEIFVDDVSVGQSPLKGPIVVDLGKRHVTAKKNGFREASAEQMIGESKTATVTLKMSADVHEGELAINAAQPNAEISIDGKVVGTGSFRGKVASGGHTLRVVAPGMQAYQTEVVVGEDEKRAIDVPLVPENKDVVLPVNSNEPVYKGFYGCLATPFWFGFGGGYVVPNNQPSTTQSAPYLGIANLKLSMGYRFGVLGIEGVLIPMFGGRFGDTTTITGQTAQVENGYPKFGVFVGPAARVSSLARYLRVTGSLGIGLSVQEIPGKILKCNNCSNNNDVGNGPGYATGAMVGDLGITLGGGSPSAKFWIGLDWFLDFAPDIVVTGLSLPAPYRNANGSVIAQHGPQFFIGPSIGVGFGH
jgi:hypothetical protein